MERGEISGEPEISGEIRGKNTASFDDPSPGNSTESTWPARGMEEDDFFGDDDDSVEDAMEEGTMEEDDEEF